MESLMQSCKSLVGQYRLNALTLNRDLVARVDEEIAFELDMTPDEVLSQHWIFQDRMYSAALADLVVAVRTVQQVAGMPGVLSDVQLSAKWLRNHGYWYEPRPHSAVSEACLFIHFLVASSMTVRRARRLIADAKGSLIQRVGLQSKAPRRQ